eukprot:scaffold77720_cov40-Attheya_sp.AAC.1
MTENKSTARGGGIGVRGYQRSYRSGGNKGPTSKTVVKRKTTITDYVFHAGSVKQASEFQTTLEFVVNYIRKMYEYSSDIGNALENLQPMDKITEKPKLKIRSLSTNAEEKIAEAEQFGIEFRVDYDQWCKRIRMYEDNCTKSYALIW